MAKFATKGGYALPADLEAGPSGDALYPGIGMTDNTLRWGFIQKVYGIIGAQLAFTAAITACFVLIPSVKGFIFTPYGWTVWPIVLLSFILLIPLHLYRQSHPLNLGLLALWTACISVTVGLACSHFKGVIILEALVLTATVVLSLTAYTFYAVKRGQDFSYWGPMLFSSLLILLVWGFVQVFLQPGPIGQCLFALVGALIFSLFIIYDTDKMIKRYSYDDYVWASLGLYLDIINLFLRLLEILGYMQRNN